MAEAITKEDLNGALKEFGQDIRADIQDLRSELGKFKEEVKLDFQGIRTELRGFKEEVRVDFKDLRKSMNEEFTGVNEQFVGVNGRFDTLESANLELLHDMKNLVTELKTHHIPSLNEDRIFS